MRGCPTPTLQATAGAIGPIRMRRFSTETHMGYHGGTRGRYAMTNSTNNPRRSNGSRRTQLRNRLKAEARPCWICVAMGKAPNVARIDYGLPPNHPYAFEVDELTPVSRYWLGGYPSAEACALDYANLASTHRCCNQWRGNRTVDEVLAIARDLKAGKRTSAKAAPRIIGEHRTSRDWRHFKPKGR